MIIQSLILNTYNKRNTLDRAYINSFTPEYFYTLIKVYFKTLIALFFKDKKIKTTLTNASFFLCLSTSFNYLKKNSIT